MPQRRLTPKKKRFIEAYTNRATECYGNATKSALVAGYAPRYARQQGSYLLQDVDISRQIKEIEEKYKRKFEVTKDQKIVMAWENYNKAVKDRDKQFWWQEICKLDGDYVTKVESKNETVIRQEEADYINQQVQSRLKEAMMQPA